MHFTNTHSAWAMLRKAKLNSACILVPDYATGRGWTVMQHGRLALTNAQRERLEAVAEQQGYNDAAPVETPRKSPVRAKGEGRAANAPVATGEERTKRMAGATTVCQAIYAEVAGDQAKYFAACEAKGIHPATAKTQWYRARRK